MDRRLLPAALLLLAGCGDPAPVPDEGVPDPQATELRDAIAEPLDKAKGVDDAEKERQAARDDALEEAGG
jgi:hypothetical protein